MALGGGGGSGASGVRAGAAYVELNAKDGMTGVLKKVAGKFADFGKLVLTLTGIGGLLGGLLGGLSFKETADDLTKMADAATAFGTTASRMSGLLGVLGAVGGEFKENLEGVIQFSGTVDDALTSASGQGAKLFAGLSVKAKDLADVPIDEKFYSVLAAIRELPQPLQEAKLAMLGGTDSMKQWQRLLGMSNEEVRELAANMAISSAELQDATAASRAMQAAGAAVGRVWQQVVIMLAPFVTQLSKAAVDAMKPVVEWLRGRTVQDIWDELVARWNLLWEQMQIGSVLILGDLWDFFARGWDNALLSVRVKFADFAVYVGQQISGAITAAFRIVPGLMGDMAKAIAAVDPATAARFGQAGKAVNDAINNAAKGGDDAVKGWAGDLKKGGQALFDEGEAKRAAAKAEREMLAGMLGAEAQARLDAALAEIEKRRQNRINSDLLDTPVGKRAASLDAIGRSLGVLGGGGAFLTQGFGIQSGEGTGKQMVKEQKKTNATLKDVVKAVENIPVPRFF